MRISKLVFLPIFTSLLLINHLNAATHDIVNIQLAKPYRENISIKDYLVSEKLDGIRARWTGEKLLTRNGNEIFPPTWFTRDWPSIPLDGELWTTRNDFQNIASIVLSNQADNRWKQVKMMIFDSPLPDTPFSKRITILQQAIENTDNLTLQIIEQTTVSSIENLHKFLDEVIRRDGEGLMLHHKDALYKNGRNNQLLKLKRFDDAEAKVIGYTKGKGKFKGMVGALIVELANGKQFKIGSGLTHIQRQNPPPINSWITFKYYGKTKSGLPRFASFLRERSSKTILQSSRQLEWLY